MKQLKVRAARPEDTKEIAEWLCSTPQNLFDQNILSYPTFSAVSSYDGDGNVAHLPAQKVTMLESLAVKPGISILDAAQSFRDLVKAMELVSSTYGIREMYFICKDDNVLRIAEGHGFERVQFPIVRMKL